MFRHRTLAKADILWILSLTPVFNVGVRSKLLAFVVLVTKDYVDSFQDEIMGITHKIMGELETKYLVRSN